MKTSELTTRTPQSSSVNTAAVGQAPTCDSASTGLTETSVAGATPLGSIDLLAPPKQSNFGPSLNRLESRLEWVPHGWQIPFADMLVKLHAVDCYSRTQINLSGPYVSESSMMIDIEPSDSVVAGIVRKAMMVTECTCYQCGALGRRRKLDLGDRILCPSCFAPRLMSQQLRKVCALLAGPDVSQSDARKIVLKFTPWVADSILFSTYSQHDKNDEPEFDYPLHAMREEIEYILASVNSLLEP